jgi:hypothetical protein
MERQTNLAAVIEALDLKDVTMVEQSGNAQGQAWLQPALLKNNALLFAPRIVFRFRWWWHS